MDILISLKIIDWNNFEEPKPQLIGNRLYDKVELEEIASYIDWSPFFWTWELKGTYPKILSHKSYGKQAQSLFKDAQTYLKNIIDKKIFKPLAIAGIWKANSNGDDIKIYNSLDKSDLKGTFHFLRQQQPNNKTSFCLSDFIAPESTEKVDYIGGFAVTIGNQVEKYAKTFEDKGDDYSSILIKALGDRLAEALAELMHKKMRSLFHPNSQEDLSLNDLIKEKYNGIRPAHGYPACPDHTEKTFLWELLDVEDKIGVSLTSSLAMNPPSSVSGLYFFNKDAKYFNVGPISQDQVKSYSTRKNISVKEAEKWLSSNLGYITE